MSRIRYYLDHASTSWPKPPGVIEAVTHCLVVCGASAGRGSYQSAIDAESYVENTRRSLARYLNATSEEIAFVSNGTHALNAIIHGIMSAPDSRRSRVVTTAIEHNSLLRPLVRCSRSANMELIVVPCDQDGRVDPSQMIDAIDSDTYAVFMGHVSNVTGTVQNIEAIGEHARRSGALFIVDAAQSIGTIPLDLKSIPIDAMAASGHKGLGGVLGTGVIFASKDIQARMASYILGGTGNASHLIEGTFPWIESIEAGNRNVPAIASLGAALDWIAKDPDNPQTSRLSDAIAKIKNCDHIRLVGLDYTAASVVPERTSVISVVPSFDCHPGACHELSLLLDSALGVETRSGFHCAGTIHRFLGTDQCGGTLRFSLGRTSSPEDWTALMQSIDLIDESAAQWR